MNLYVGTSGWSYPNWQGIFYPAEVKSKQYLEYYATQFNSVELNSSFYRLPKLEVVKGWRQRTPQNFHLCPKLSRWITHVKRLHEPEEPLEKFMSLFKALKHKLGPILVQLPPNLSLDSHYIEPFFDLFKNQYGNFQFAIEARHGSWISKAAFDLLDRYHLAWVIADSGGLYPEAVHVNSDLVYLRFHGRKELYASNYSSRELQPFAKKAKAWLEQGKKVWAFFNNDALGYAAANARVFRDLIIQ